MSITAQSNTAEENMNASFIIRAWVSEELKEDSSVVLRTNNNVLYNYTGSFPFTTQDFNAEKDAGLWVAVVKGSANDFTTEIKNEIASFEDKIAALTSGFKYPIPQAGNTASDEPAPTVNASYTASPGTFTNWLDADGNAVVVPTTTGFIHYILASGIGGSGLVCKLSSVDLNFTAEEIATEGSTSPIQSNAVFDIKVALEASIALKQDPLIIKEVALGSQLFDKLNYVKAYIQTSNGALIPNEDSVTTQILPFYGFGKHRVSGLGGNNYALGYRFLDKFGAVVSFANSSSNVTQYSFTPPVNPLILFYQATIKTFKPENVTNLDLVLVEMNDFQTSVKPYIGGLLGLDGLNNKILPATFGKKVKIHGDSNFESIKADGGNTESWTSYTDQYLKAQIFNYAKAGTAYKDKLSTSDEWQRISYQLAQSESEGIEADIVLFGCGVNDGLNAITTFESAMAVENIEDLDREDLYQAIRYAFWKARLIDPNAMFFASNLFQTKKNTQAYYAPVNLAIKKMCAEYGYIYIDAEGESGVVRQFEVFNGQGRLLYDGLHLDTNGNLVCSVFFSSIILKHFISSISL